MDLRHYACPLRHHYQNEYWVAKGFDFDKLDADPDGRESRDPPSHQDDTHQDNVPLKPPKKNFQYTDGIPNAATGRDWNNNRSNWRK